MGSEALSHLCELGYSQMIANMAALVTMDSGGYVSKEHFAGMVEQARKGYIETLKGSLN